MRSTVRALARTLTAFKTSGATNPAENFRRSRYTGSSCSVLPYAKLGTAYLLKDGIKVAGPPFVRGPREKSIPGSVLERVSFASVESFARLFCRVPLAGSMLMQPRLLGGNNTVGFPKGAIIPFGQERGQNPAREVASSIGRNSKGGFTAGMDIFSRLGYEAIKLAANMDSQE